MRCRLGRDMRRDSFEGPKKWLARLAEFSRNELARLPEFSRSEPPPPVAPPQAPGLTPVLEARRQLRQGLEASGPREALAGSVGYQ